MPQVDVTEMRDAGRQTVALQAVRNDVAFRQHPRRDGRSDTRMNFRLAAHHPIDSAKQGGLSAISFWKRVLTRARGETLEAVRLDTFVRALTGIAAPFVGFLIVVALTRQPTWAGIATVGVVLMIAVIVFLCKAFSLPAKIVHDLELAGAEVASQAMDGELEYRAELVNRLALYYVEACDNASARARAGLEMPPLDWINMQLLELGEEWFVHDVRGTRYYISERTNIPVLDGAKQAIEK